MSIKGMDVSCTKIFTVVNNNMDNSMFKVPISMTHEIVFSFYGVPGLKMLSFHITKTDSNKCRTSRVLFVFL